jgi:uncharacterized small protein (TIGR04563 family)
MKDGRKKSLYFPRRMLDELEEQADRQDRSISWLVQQAWALAKKQVTRLTPATGIPIPARGSRTARKGG